MSQQLSFKRAEVVLEEPQTLRAILKKKMLEQNLELETLDKLSNHLIFNVEGVMERNIDTEIKSGATVKLIPFAKAG